MAEVLGLGISHYPPLSGTNADMANILRGRLRDPDIPSAVKDPAAWPALMRAEWGTDEGTRAAAEHRAAMLRGIRKVREALDAFKPDVVLIWGDDQYENFKEDVIPAFSVQAYSDMDVYPWKHASASAMFDAKTKDEWGGGRANAWGEGPEMCLRVKGHVQAAKFLANRLLEQEFDVAYAYKPLHHPGIAHAFLNAMLYLDYDRNGFPYPTVPFVINCYGRAIISYAGFVSRWADRGREPDPPSPSPRRCWDMGAAVGRIFRDSPYRVALIASSSWSHAFLTDRTWRMQPDVAADRNLYEAMIKGEYGLWRDYTLAEIEDAGQQEVLNWFALIGAMGALNQRCAWSDFVETYVFNSSKVAAIFPPS